MEIRVTPSAVFNKRTQDWEDAIQIIRGDSSIKVAMTEMPELLRELETYRFKFTKKDSLPV